MATTVQLTDVEDHPTLEQLSDLLDEGAPEARAHVDGCSRCAGLLRRLEATREVLRQEVALPPHLVDAAVAAGVAAGTPTTEITSLSRARRPKPFLLVAGIAAALVAVLGLASLVNSFGGGRAADSIAGGADDSAVESEDAGTGGGLATADAEASTRASEPGAPGGAAGSGNAGEAAPLMERRGLSGPDEVVAYLRSSADAMAATATSCSTEAADALAAPLERLRSEDITYQDGPANLWVDPAQRRALVMRPGGCSLAADLQY